MRVLRRAWSRILLWIAVLASCAHPPARPATPPVRARAVESSPACVVPDGGALPGYLDVCDGVVDAHGRACARCPSAHSCTDLVDFVYCVAGDCSDPACHVDGP